MNTTFQTTLTNVATGHRIYKVYATNAQLSQGDITLVGPINISAKVIVNP